MNFTASFCQTLEPFLDVQVRDSLPNFYIIASIVACVFNIITCCATLLLNTTVILSICWTPSLRHETKNILLCSLAVSDFFVGLSCQPSFVVAEICLILGRMEYYCYAVFIHFYTSWLFSGVSFLTLSAISVERYLALHFHLRYTELITTTRVIITVFIYWFIWITWITILWFGVRIRLFTYILVAFCCLIALGDSLCYVMIFKTVKRHNVHMKHSRSQDGRDMARFRRTTNTMILLVGAFVGSYIPFVITTSISASQAKEDMRVSIAHCVAVALVFTNAAVNPLIYFWRVSELREAAKLTLRKIHLMRPENRVESEFDSRLWQNMLSVFSLEFTWLKGDKKLKEIVISTFSAGRTCLLYPSLEYSSVSIALATKIRVRVLFKII